MTEPTRGLLDTSMPIDYDVIDPMSLPDEGIRPPCARQLERLGNPVVRAFADLLIASTAAANTLPLYPRNPDDFHALKDIAKVIAI